MEAHRRFCQSSQGQEKVEGAKGFEEKGSHGKVIMAAHRSNLRVAKGYRRIVYGDHGPYLEFDYDQIHWPSFERKIKSEKAYYDEAHSEDGKVKHYSQTKMVGNCPNPPRGTPSALSAFEAREENVENEEKASAAHVAGMQMKMGNCKRHRFFDLREVPSFGDGERQAVFKLSDKVEG